MTQGTIEETATAAAQDARPPTGEWTLFVDPATMSGWAVGKPNGDGGLTFMSGRWDLRPKKDDADVVRYLRLYDEMTNIKQAVPVGRVAYEKVHAHKGVRAAHIYGALEATMQRWCHEHGLPEPEGVSVQAIKIHGFGKGNATKEQMVAAVEQKWGIIPIDDNEADAVAGLHLILGVA